jgi:hypothetical protein
MGIKTPEPETAVSVTPSNGGRERPPHTNRDTG